MIAAAKNQLTRPDAVTDTASRAEPQGTPDGGRCPNHPWYVVQTHHQQERVAVRDIADRSATLGLNVLAYLPMQATERTAKGVRTTVHVPMFSQYLFVQVAPDTPWSFLRYADGVKRIFCTPTMKPIAVPQGFVERLIREAPMRLSLPDVELDILDRGALVRALDGPLTGFTGSVMACDGKLTQVDFELFGRTSPVSVRRVDVQRIV